jgi:hypothetical protein
MSRLAAAGPSWWAGFVLLVVSGLTLALAFEPVEFTFRWLTNGDGAALGIAPMTAAGLKVLAVAAFCPLILAVFSRDMSGTVAQIVLFWIRGVKFGAVCLLAILPLAALQSVFRIAAQFGFIDVETRIGGWIQFLAWLVALLLAPFWALAVLKRLPRSALGQGTLAELSKRFSVAASEDSRPGRRPN